MEEANNDEDLGTIGLGCALELFQESEEVHSMIQKLKDFYEESMTEKNYERFLYVLSLYQEQPHLLDPHLDKMLNNLVEIVRDPNKTLYNKHEAFKYMYVIMKVRGYKIVVRQLPHEISDIEPVLQMLEGQDPTDNFTWESTYVLILWLSIIVLIPFHMSRLDSFQPGEGSKKSVMERVLTICKTYLVTANLSSITAFLASRFLTRSDIKESYLKPFFEWAQNMVTESESPLAQCGCLAAIASILKHGRREDLISCAPNLLRWMLGTNYRNSKNVLLRRLGIKVLQRIGLIFLKPRIAPWRYDRGSRSLVANLKAAGDSFPTQTSSIIPNEKQQLQKNVDEEEEVEVPEEVEEVVEELIQGLRDTESVIRWSSAKGIGRITDRLPADLADDVVGSVLDLFSVHEMDSAWHGGCLALAELGRRGLLLPARLSTVVPLILNALVYDEPRGYVSVGAHIRDAACYVCWSFARAYDKQVLEPYVQDIAAALLVVCSFDREINCRRAASAAFQENVGRQGTFPHGIDILTTADFFAVSVRKNAYLNISVFVAQFEEYTLHLINHLIDRKVDHWDVVIRELTAEALHNLASLAPSYMATEVLDRLLAMTDSLNVNARHGAVLAIGEIMHALHLSSKSASVQDFVGEEKINQVKELIPKFQKRFQFLGLGGELMKQACSSLIENCSRSKLPFHGMPVIDDWQSLLDECLSHEVSAVRDRACSALQAFFSEYYFKSDGTINSSQKESVVLQYCKRLTSPDQTSRMGYAIAIGSFPKFLLEGNLPHILSSLITCSQITDHTLTWCESRRDAIKALTAICNTVGISDIVRVCDDYIQKLFECFLMGLSEYTTDSRGDIGSWVRQASMTGLQVLLLLILKEDPLLLKNGVVSKAIVGIAQQAVEKIDNTRSHAGKVFATLLHSKPELPGFPHIMELKKIFPFEDCEKHIDWKQEAETFPRFCHLISLHTFTYNVMLGFLISMGTITQRLTKHSGSAFLSHLRTSQADEVELKRLANTMCVIWEDHLYLERVVVPLMVAVDQILGSGVFSSILCQPNSELSANILRLVKLEANKAGTNTRRLGGVISILCELIQVPGSVSRKAVGHLSRYLCVKFLWTRKTTAARLYESLLVYGEELVGPENNLDAAMTILSDTNWELPLETVRPLRDQLCCHLGIKPPRPVAKEGS